MVTTILIAVVLFLTLVLAIGFRIQYAAHARRMAERKRRNSVMWRSVFERTDLRKEQK